MKRTIQAARVIITGASSGIGRALSVELATRGAYLTLVARREFKLHALADEIRSSGGRAAVVAGDITLDEVRRKAMSCCVAEFGGLDLLINNAGRGATGRFENALPDRSRQIMELNYFAAIEMIRLALPALKIARRPMIVNVASILGQRGIPWHSEYCASKFALRGFSESLRSEVARLGIDVLTVSPGTTESEFFEQLIEKETQLPWGNQVGVPAQYVAKQTCDAICRGKHEIVPNPRGRWMCWLNRLAPRLLDRIMARYG